MKRTFVILSTVMAILLSACGGRQPAPADTGPAVSTAVAMTVAAQQPAASPTPDYKALYEASLSATPGAPTAMSTPTAGAANAPDQSGASQSFNGVASFTINGAPARVDPANVLRAQGADAYGNFFTNTVGFGTEMMFAEPGSILYGPDEPASVVKANPHGEYISPINQQMLGTETFATNTAEGAFTWATGAVMTIRVNDYTIRVESTGKSCSNNWFVVIRGLFADGKQDSDRNSTTNFSNYVAGHTQVMWYPAGAYISEGNFKQVAELSHTGGRNCGAEGTSGLSVLMLDLNTGAYAVVYQANLGQPWQAIASNWR